MVRSIGLIALALSLAAAHALALDAPLVQGVDGGPFRATLEAASPDWRLAFSESGKRRELSADRLAIWGQFVEPAGGAQVVLADGGLLVSESVRMDKELLRGVSASCAAWSLPLELVAGIVLRPPADRPTLDALLARIAAAGGAGDSVSLDRVLLHNGDELRGTVEGLQESVLALQTDVGKSDLPLDQVAGVIFSPTLVHKSRASGLRALVGLGDGTRLSVIGLVVDDKQAKFKLAGGAELGAPREAIACLQPLGGRVVYLSDLQPAGYRHVPFLQLSWPYQNDRNVLGGQLRAAGHVYAKGLGMHSPARMTYDLGGAYRRFEADLAVDADAGNRGSVVYRVFTDDGSGKLIERATSEIVRGGQPPVPIAVDLTGVKRLSLLVDYADHGDVLDHADWLNARLVR